MKKIKLLALFGAMLILLVCCGSAMAADDPLKVSMQLSTTTFSEPTTVTVSIQVANSGEGDLKDPVTLYYPNGKQVEEFGAPVLSVGTSKVWTGTWDVTENQLEAGRITFKIKYTVYDDEGNKIAKSKNFYKKIDYTGAVANVEINRSISANTAAEGQEVNVTYTVVNTGNVAVSDVKITEDKSISGKVGVIESVAPGTRETYTFTTTMGKKDLTSKPSITYVASGATQKTALDAATVKFGEVNLKASLTADKKGTVVGDVVTLTLTLKNSGKTDFTGLMVTDAILGKVFTDVSVPAGETVELTRSMTMSDTADYQFAITGADTEGTELSISSDRVNVKALQADQVIDLEVKAEADRTVVYEFPAHVKFHITVTNRSGVDVGKVNVKAGDVVLYTFPEILMGETREFTRSVDIVMAGRFQFKATVTNMLDETQTFESNIIPIDIAEPTAVPTAAPIVTPPKPNLVPVPEGVEISKSVTDMYEMSGIAALVFLGLAGIGALLLIVALVSRALKATGHTRVKSSFTLVGNRDYLASEEGGTEEETTPEPVQEEPVKTEEVPEEMKNLMPEDQQKNS